MGEIRKMRRLTTEKQREAARKNGAKSTGPKTPEGKRTSSLNALRHALTSTLMVLTIEDESRFEALRDTYIEEFQPETQLEYDLIEEMTAAKWRQKRAWLFQNAILDVQVERMDDQIAKQFTHLDNGIRGALAFAEESDQSESLALLQRYESMHARHFRRAWKDLLMLRDRRQQQKLPNEPDKPVTQAESEEIPANEASGEHRQPPLLPLTTGHFRERSNQSRRAPRLAFSNAYFGEPLDIGDFGEPLATHHSSPATN